VDNCTVKDLTIKDSYGNGILIYGDHNMVYKCHFHLEDWWECASGVEVRGCHNLIWKCAITSPEEGYSWHGVALISGGYNTVLNCEFENICESIFILSPYNNIISNEILYGYTGIYGYGETTDSLIFNNEIMYTGCGIDISKMGGWSVTPQDNLITWNTIGDNYCGIYLWRTNENMVCCNNICNNDVGLWISESNENVLRRNKICNNEVAFDFRGGSSDNVLHHNKMIKNTDAFGTGGYEDENIWNNGYGRGNYWDDYEGEDTDKDGVGDTDLPHNGVDYYPLMSRWQLY